MVTLSSPTVARRWLALELRRLRHDRGTAQKDAGRQLGWSGARLSFFENAQQNLGKPDLDKLLQLYEVPEDERDAYYDALTRARANGWWARYESLMPDWAAHYIGLEQGAAEIRVYQPVLVPGPLQTPDYFAALIKSDVRPLSPRQIDLLVELRIKRRDILLRAEEPTELSAVIGEAVLSQPPADSNGQVMAAQVGHLIEVAQRPNVTLRVLPQRRSAHNYSPGPFHILTFPWQQPDSSIVFIERRDGALFLDIFEDIESHIVAFDAIAAMALSPDESLALMREATER